MKLQRLFIFVAVVASCNSPGTAGETVTFDFNSGTGPNFQAFDVPPSGLWTVDTDGPTLRIAKPSDAGTINPNGFLNAGIRSIFTIDGDFAFPTGDHAAAFQHRERLDS